MSLVGVVGFIWSGFFIDVGVGVVFLVGSGGCRCG